MRTMTLSDAKARLSAAVYLVATGEEIVITRRGKPVARIVREVERPVGNTAALLKEMQKFVMAQSLQEESSVELVRHMRDGNRY